MDPQALAGELLAACGAARLIPRPCERPGGVATDAAFDGPLNALRLSSTE